MTDNQDNEPFESIYADVNFLDNRTELVIDGTIAMSTDTANDDVVDEIARRWNSYPELEEEKKLLRERYQQERGYVDSLESVSKIEKAEISRLKEENEKLKRAFAEKASDFKAVAKAYEEKKNASFENAFNSVAMEHQGREMEALQSQLKEAKERIEELKALEGGE